MACSIEGLQPEFVPPGLLCSDSFCDQLTELLVNESALDDLWRAQGFPTPPTTPERVYTPNNDIDIEDDSECDTSQDLPMLNELILLAYGEEVLTSNPVVVPTVATETSAASLQDNLIQDCMWSSHICDRSFRKPPPLPPLPPLLSPSPHKSPGEQGGGVYTPAPSPPPPPAVVVGGDGSHDDDGMESDCVSPSAVFPSLLTPTTPAAAKTTTVGSKVESAPVTMETAEPTLSSPLKKPLRGVLRNKVSDDPDWEESSEDTGGRHGYERGQRRKRRLSTATVGTTGANGRQQPQSESSTSDEEIDVVTVTTSADRVKLPRKRCHPSLSAPCSRQTSPHPPPKRRKYHTKRLQRLSSAGSTVGEAIESDDEARRASHNILERKRRNDLKSSFQRLREEIPELEENQRAPKVIILRKATEYIRHMQELERAAEVELVAERRRKTKLLERLNRLKSGRV